MSALSPMIVLLSEDDGVSKSQFVAVDQIAAVLPITDGSEVHLRSGTVLRTSLKPRKVVAQMTAAVTMLTRDGES